MRFTKFTSNNNINATHTLLHQLSLLGRYARTQPLCIRLSQSTPNLLQPQTILFFLHIRKQLINWKIRLKIWADTPALFRWADEQKTCKRGQTQIVPLFILNNLYIVSISTLYYNQEYDYDHFQMPTYTQIYSADSSDQL